MTLYSFSKIYFTKWKNSPPKKNPCVQVEELRKIKLKTTYPAFNGLGLAKDVVFQILHLMVP
jgi:hypothetical protein